MKSAADGAVDEAFVGWPASARRIGGRRPGSASVSSDSGLEQEFNSLDNQREASEAYVKSQAHEGWK